MTDHSFELILLRHGQTTRSGDLIGQTDAPLSDTGLAQMISARSRLGELTCIASSSLQRCLLPARQWADESGLTLHVDSRFTEYNFGIWEGRSLTELEAQEPGWQQRLWRGEQYLPDSETRQAFEQRILDGFSHWLTVGTGHKRLLVCHGGVITILLAHLLNMPADAARQIAILRGGCIKLAMLPPNPAWMTALINPE